MSGAPRSNQSSRRAGLSAAAVVGIAIVVVGFLAGRYAAFLDSKPAFFARIDVLVVVGGTVLAGLLVAYVAGRVARARPGALAGIGRARVAVIGLVVAGLATGFATAAATGALYREPAVLEAIGKAAGDLTDVSGFVGAGDMPARCRSVPDGAIVSEVIADDLGSIDGLTLRAGLTIPEAPTDFRGDIFVDGGALPANTMQPFWAGTMSITELAADGRRGLLTFSGLELVQDRGTGPKPNGEPWPTTLAGSIRWTCGEWLQPST